MKFNRENLLSSHQLPLFIIDMLMLGLLIINLLWILIDTLYSIGIIHDWIIGFLPIVHTYYHPVHDNFLLVDLTFVSIFLTEFLIRWIISIYQKEYFRWYFYPFVHWYDLVGCIPVGPYRFLRFLRVFSICYRLHKYRIVDFTNNRIYRFFRFYYNVIIEELSDRIVINVLQGSQREIKHGSPLFHEIINNILIPRKQLLIQWISDAIEDKTRQILDDKHTDLRKYIEHTVSEAVYNNPEIDRIQSTPVLGPLIAGTLNDAIADIVFHTIENILKDLSSPDNKALVAELTDTLLTTSDQISVNDEPLRELIIEVLEAVKSQVAVQHWKREATDQTE
ncbi:MAG: hypothetical protein MI864_13270 [Pseudomonadales bacterium]|nr:hypothetical protein [Pseudomonadales bacterium]